jgi:hypothetical protein
MPISETLRPKPSGLLTFVWALFFFFVFALLVVIWVRASGPRETVEDKRAATRKAKLADLQKADAEKLASAGWVDQAKGTVHIPIADAKRLLIAELKSKKPTVSQVKVEPPLPMPPPPDPNATEPPPAVLPSSPQGADTLRFDLPNPAGAAPEAAPAPAIPAALPAPGAPAPGAAPSATSAPPAIPPPPPQPTVTPPPARPPLINSTNPK